MYEIDKRKIGEYLKPLIDKKFKSRRDFCRKYLELSGLRNIEDALQNTSNRVSQILNGLKEIQTYDLRIFADILNISCEEILTAGEITAKKSGRMTNYSIVFSEDRFEWDEYATLPKNPMLNQDEFGKNAIDYAFEYKRYAFLKYIFENGYKVDREEYRFLLIIWALMENDLNMLKLLDAREITYRDESKVAKECTEKRSEQLIKDLVKQLSYTKNKEILNYFSGEFIDFRDDDIDDICNITVFYMMPELLELMIKANHRYTNLVLKNLKKHNENVIKYLKSMGTRLNKNNDYGDIYKEIERYVIEESDNTVNKIDLFDFDKNLGNPYSKLAGHGYTAHTIGLELRSEDEETQRLIDEVNACDAVFDNYNKKLYEKLVKEQEKCKK